MTMRRFDGEFRMCCSTGSAPSSSRKTQASNFSFKKRWVGSSVAGVPLMPNWRKQSRRISPTLSSRPIIARRAMTLRAGTPRLPVVAMKWEGYCVAWAQFSQRLSGRSLSYSLLSSFNSVPTVHLCHIEGRIGGAHQLIAIFGMIGKVGHARADGHRPRNAGKLEFLHHATQLFSDRPSTVGMRLRHQDGKFLSPVTANQVVLADVLSENLRDLSEHLVAKQVPELIIQLFEVIDVDHQQREPKAVAFGGAQRLDDTSLKSTAVVDTGQPVGACHGLGLVQLHGIADADGADIGDRSEHANVFFLEVVWLRRLQHQDAECLFQRDQREAQLRTRFLEARDVSLRTGDVVLHHDLAAVEGGTAEAVAGRQLPLACHESSELARVGAHQ